MKLADFVGKMLEIIAVTGGEGEDYRDAIMAGYDASRDDVDRTRAAKALLLFMGPDILPLLTSKRDNADNQEIQLCAKIMVMLVERQLHALPESYRVRKPDNQKWNAYITELIQQADTDDDIFNALKETPAEFGGCIVRALPHTGAKKLFAEFVTTPGFMQSILPTYLEPSLPPETLIAVITTFGETCLVKAHGYINISSDAYHICLQLTGLLEHIKPEIRHITAYWLAHAYPFHDDKQIILHRIKDAHAKYESPKLAEALQTMGYDPTAD